MRRYYIAACVPPFICVNNFWCTVTTVAAILIRSYWALGILLVYNATIHQLCAVHNEDISPPVAYRPQTASGTLNGDTTARPHRQNISNNSSPSNVCENRIITFSICQSPPRRPKAPSRSQFPVSGEQHRVSKQLGWMAVPRKKCQAFWMSFRDASPDLLIKWKKQN